MHMHKYKTKLPSGAKTFNQNKFYSIVSVTRHLYWELKSYLLITLTLQTILLDFSMFPSYRNKRQLCETHAISKIPVSEL